MRPPCGLLVVLFLTVLPTASAADDTAGRVAAALDSGDLEQAEKLASRALSRKPGAELGASLHLLRARARHGLGRKDLAKEDLTAALQLDAVVELDPENTNPELVAQLSKARKELSGRIVISSNRGTVDVLLDDVPLGQAPLTAIASAGRHQVTAVHEGQRISQETVVPARGQSSVLFQFSGTSGAQAGKLPSPGADEPRAGGSSDPGASALTPQVGTAREVGVLPYAAIGGGVALAAAGVAGALYSRGVQERFARQQEPGGPLSVTRAEASRASTLMPLSIAATVAGASIAAFGGWSLFRSPPPVALVVGEGGAVVTVGDRF